MVERKRVPIAEAARLLGVSTDTVKRRIQRGQLHGQKVRTSRGEVWHIELEEDLLDQDDEHAENVSPAQAIAALKAANDALIATRHLLERQLEARAVEIHELHVLLQQAHGRPVQRLAEIPETMPPQQPRHLAQRRRGWLQRLTDWLRG